MLAGWGTIPLESYYIQRLRAVGNASVAGSIQCSQRKAGSCKCEFQEIEMVRYLRAVSKVELSCCDVEGQEYVHHTRHAFTCSLRCAVAASPLRATAGLPRRIAKKAAGLHVLHGWGKNKEERGHLHVACSVLVCTSIRQHE